MNFPSGQIFPSFTCRIQVLKVGSPETSSRLPLSSNPFLLKAFRPISCDHLVGRLGVSETQVPHRSACLLLGWARYTRSDRRGGGRQKRQGKSSFHRQGVTNPVSRRAVSQNLAVAARDWLVISTAGRRRQEKEWPVRPSLATGKTTPPSPHTPVATPTPLYVTFTSATYTCHDQMASPTPVSA
ncbi:hypothetical protein Bbelb_335680 [Branchiostoma belcheri]|nr:hypothetical protein Bbelb_335680 [Branchiostoma belcheri]